jgi:hypothetical protein
MKSVSIIKTAKEDNEVNPSVDDFSMLENVVEPLVRGEKGVWVKDVDFLICFNRVQIVYNPVSFGNKAIEKISTTTVDGAFVFD